MNPINPYELDELASGSPKTQWAVEQRAARGREKEKEERKETPNNKPQEEQPNEHTGKKTKKERQRKNRDGSAHKATATKREGQRGRNRVKSNPRQTHHHDGTEDVHT